MVQVELRDNKSISPARSAGNRAAASSGTNRTLPASAKIAAAIARHRSTSKPVQLPLPSRLEKPARPWLTPHTSSPRSRTLASVCAAAGPGSANAKTKAAASKPRNARTRIRDGVRARQMRGGIGGVDARLRRKSPGMALPLQFRTLPHDDLGPDRHTIVEIDDVPVHQPEAARRHRMPDRLRLIGAVNAVD